MDETAHGVLDTAPDAPESTSGSQFRVLGLLQVSVRGELQPLGGPKQRALLGMLIAEAPKSISAESLIEGLWGERASSGSRSTLQTYVSNLRHVLGDALAYDRGAYRLDVDPSSIDAVEFTTALEEARKRITTNPDQVAAGLRRVLGTWRGRPYADLMDIPGLEAEIRRLEVLRLEAVELRIEADLAVGRYRELISELEALAEEHPTRERFRAQHMLALYRSGRQGDALRAYRRTETYLAEELGVDPSPELRDLELRILQQDESLLTRVTQPLTQRLAFLVTDIEGSTKLWDEFPQAMATALAEHDLILTEEVQRAGGRLFKHTGDGVLAAFPDALSAVSASERILTRLARAEWDEIAEVRVRIGIDVGEAESRGDDFYGPPLNRAARLCAVAHGGQVVVSAAAEREITDSAPAGLQIRHLGEVHLRGMAAPERVAQLVFVGLPAEFPELRKDVGISIDDRIEALSLPGYEIRERIGEGAFGVVWRAYQPSVGREVAVKVVRPELAAQPSFVRRFEAEARTIARLAHPHIVPLIDYWRDEARAYLVLGLLPGGSLEMAIRRREIDSTAARRILAQVGSALDHAHSRGIPHGDLKPANVLLDGSGNAYLSDFGLPTRLLGADSMPYSSAPEFRAPEESESGPSPSADLFAFGRLARTLFGDIPELEAVFARATASAPSDRYGSGDEMVADIEQSLGVEAEEVERSAVSRNPYKGLRHFDEGDTADFFGRNDLTATLVAAMSTHRFVTVVGPSGSGKSSVVRSGLLPALASGALVGSETWLPIVLAPGDDPQGALARAIQKGTGSTLPNSDSLGESLTSWLSSLDPDGTVLLVIDQFEELYTLVDDDSMRADFVDLLTEMVGDQSTIRVVVTLRADFYDRPLADPRLAMLVRDGQITVLPPTRDELIDMIASPAQAVGLRFEPGLPHRIAEDVAHQPGGLPLLQYALTELVERRSSDILTGDDYSRIGEVAGALAKRAEDLYLEMTPSQQRAARSVLLRLVTVDEESDDTRRRVRRGELESLGIPLADLNAVLDVFTAERLLLADRDPVARTPTIEVAHEALLREWPRLEHWIDDQREALILGRRFRAALDDWEANDRHDDYLLTGTRLAPFAGWAQSAPLSTAEQTFFAASVQKDQSIGAARRRRRRTLIGVLAGATAVASVFGLVAALQAEQAGKERDRAIVAEAAAETERDRAVTAESLAEQEAENARIAEQIAFSRELAASAVSALSDDPELTLLLGLEAMSNTPEADALPLHFYTAFHTALHAARTTLNQPWETEWEVDGWDGLISPDGTKVAVVPTVDTVEMRDVASGESLWQVSDDSGGGWFWHPHFSPDSSTLAVAYTRYWSEERRVESDMATAIYLLSADTGDVLDIIEPPHECPIEETRDDSPVVDYRWIGLPLTGAFTRDGSQLVRLVDSPEDDGSGCLDTAVDVEFVDLETGEVVARFPATVNLIEGFPVFVTVGVDSTNTVAIMTDESDGAGSTRAYDLGTQEVRWSSPSAVMGFLSPDGSTLASAIPGPAQLDIDISDPLTGEVRTRLVETSWAGLIAFNGDGSRLYTARADGSAGVWDTATGTRQLDIGTPSYMGRISVDNAGSSLAAVGPEGLRIFDLTSSPLAEVFALDISPHQAATGALDAAADRLAVAGFHGRCPEQYIEGFVIDLAAGDVLDRFHDLGGNTLALSPDGGSLIQQLSLPDDPDVACSEKTVGAIVVKSILNGGYRELNGLYPYLNDPEVPWPSECENPLQDPYCEFVLDMSITPDARLLAASGTSGAFSVWDLETGDVVTTQDLDPDCCVSGVALHPSGSMVAATARGASSRMVVFDINGEILYEQPGLGGRIMFTADGKYLVTDLPGGEVRVFDVNDWSWWELTLHQGAVLELDVSPNSGSVVTVGGDGFVKVFDTESRTIVHEINLGDDFAKSVAFVNDVHIAIGTQKGLVAVLTIDAVELAEIARSRLTRTLTEQECQTYLHLEGCPDPTVGR